MISDERVVAVGVEEVYCAGVTMDDLIARLQAMAKAFGETQGGLLCVQAAAAIRERDEEMIGLRRGVEVWKQRGELAELAIRESDERIAELIHDVGRHMTIANAELARAERAEAEVARLREALGDVVGEYTQYFVGNGPIDEEIKAARTVLSKPTEPKT